MYWAVAEGADQDDETLIGELPYAWNWLADWYPDSDAVNAKLVRAADTCVDAARTRGCRFTGPTARRRIPTTARASTPTAALACRYKTSGWRT